MVVEIVVPQEVQKRLQVALKAAGRKEIGGLLMGECLEPGRFRLADLTIQRSQGSLASFIRHLGEAISALANFFRRTGENYTQFNYLGEWHSHPSFSTNPSERDVLSMLEIAGDPEVGANFVALVIVRLDSCETLTGSASVYWPDGRYEKAILSLETGYG